MVNITDDEEDDQTYVDHSHYHSSSIEQKRRHAEKDRAYSKTDSHGETLSRRGPALLTNSL